ncbi:MAG: hypothetical protein M3Q66_06055 [Chloroflexota bacterium]|nr:hypothetical protein [Chloroflexota bacterium]
MSATSIRRLAGGSAALLLAAATLLSATGAALAAVPSADAASSSVPGSYSAGNAAGFRGTFHFTDGSTLAKLYLNLKTTGADASVYFTATRNGANVAGNCTPGAALTVCAFKSVRTDDMFVVTSAYSTSAAAVTANFAWSSTGQTGSDGGTSHGDNWDNIPRTATLSNDPNYGGGFSVSTGSSISNSQAVTASNRQATKLVGLPAGVLASVLDGPDVVAPCTSNAIVDCNALIGEWSEVNVGDGQAFGSPFTIVITYYLGTPRGFVHSYLDANGVLQQETVGSCPKRNPAAAAPCFTWSAKTNQATIYTLHNGSWKGN